MLNVTSMNEYLLNDFEKRGYSVVMKQQVERNGILLTNYIMIKKGGHL